MPMANRKLSGRARDHSDSLRVYWVQKHPWPLDSYVINKLFFVMKKEKWRLCLCATPDPGLVSYSNEMAKKFYRISPR